MPRTEKWPFKFTSNEMIEPTPHQMSVAQSANDDADHIIQLCIRSMRRLRAISKLDPIPSSLVRGEADVLEKWLVELKVIRGA